MTAELRVLGDMIDHHPLPAAADFVTDGGLNLQLAAWCHAKGDVVLDGAAHPAVVGHPRHGRKAHAGGAADHFQDGGNARNGGNGVQVGLEIVG